jgi:antitoxin component YwqK of YwqJK toxin-antitoxin module
MQRVAAKELEYAEDGLYYFNGKPFTGTAIYYLKSGWENAEMEFRDGLQWGPAKEWYGPGIPMRDATFLNGALHGRAKEWHKNGQIAEDGEYEHGITLWEKKWDEQGNLESDYVLKESDSNFEMLKKFRLLYGNLT